MSRQSLRVVDVHSHVVPADFPAMPSTCTCGHQWPHMHRHDDGSGSVMIGGKAFRRLDGRSWQAERRLADMDGEDVRLQALSPMPELLSYWMEPEATLALGRHVNAAIAELVAANPTRFVGLGMVPLQEPQLAAQEAQRLKAEGFAGVEIGSNILGRSPGDPFFDPFYAEAERLGLCLFVHALHPAATDRLVGPKPPLAAFIGFPGDVGLAAASFITGATLRKFPRLRIGFSHGGGTLAALLPRLQNGWHVAPELQPLFDAPLAMARRFWYDNIVLDDGFLAYLVQTFGSTQVLAGSDYPYLAGQRFPGRPFEALRLSDAQLHDVLAGNAQRYLGLDGAGWGLMGLDGA